MKVQKVVSINIEEIDKETADALATILCNITRHSVNLYLEDRGGMPNILNEEAVQKLISLGLMIRRS
jgi:hypothetical protein